MNHLQPPLFTAEGETHCGARGKTILSSVEDDVFRGEKASSILTQQQCTTAQPHSVQLFTSHPLTYNHYNYDK